MSWKHLIDMLSQDLADDAKENQKYMRMDDVS
jgi:hypothetical protein